MKNNFFLGKAIHSLDETRNVTIEMNKCWDIPHPRFSIVPKISSVQTIGNITKEKIGPD